ncbi:MAG: ASCH domain-containing protein [Sphingomonas sp.]|uniref:ASCH domain-containing protein n=1 Tax=Sphingomonas sp. TaxID=28214 RepID=UPI00262B366B|nr:ASCH domain-containing protein [Sphingomonas sp.]MDK2769950.1 ASCH domain-containing protein [Sphingomonas sp.]
MIHPDLPLKALSIMQPWPWLIAHGFKDIENRSRRTHYRGPVALHAGKKADQEAWDDFVAGIHPVTGEPAPHFDHDKTVDLRGGIVGVADIIDCVEQSASEWFVGRYGYVLANARPVPFVPCRGELGFFDWRRNLS